MTSNYSYFKCTLADHVQLRMFTCSKCSEQFHDEILLDIHNSLYHDNESVFGNTNSEDIEQEGEDEPFLHTRPSVIQYAPPLPLNVELLAEAMPRATVRHFKIVNTTYGLSKFIDETKPLIVNTLHNELKRLNFVKFGILMDTMFTNVQDELSPRGFLTKNRTLMKTSSIESVVEDCLQDIVRKITEHEGKGSGWSLLSIISLDIRVHKHGYGDRGSSFIPLPKKISQTKACINVQNEDNECFRYSMLAKFVSGKHVERPNKQYQEVSKKYNFNGVSYPVSLNDIKRFEKQNPNVSINVFGLDQCNNVFPLQVTPMEKVDHTDLLLIKDRDVSHYVYIKNFNALVCKQLSKKREYNRMQKMFLLHQQKI